MSFNTEVIPYAAHCQWYGDMLSSNERQLLIVEIEARAVGVLRLDRAPAAGDRAEVSINIAPERRGQGLGVSILNQATELARGLGINRLTARIRPNNSASIRAFQKVGFEQTATSEVQGAPALCFELRLT
jgi:RimJ/RimL family protein N-acetyltransferase